MSFNTVSNDMQPGLTTFPDRGYTVDIRASDQFQNPNEWSISWLTNMEYEHYASLWKEISDESNIASAQNVTELFRRSGLPDILLEQIWDICDSVGSGYLGFDRFCLACRLIAHAQSGLNIHTSIIFEPSILPSFDRNINDTYISPVNNIQYTDDMMKGGYFVLSEQQVQKVNNLFHLSDADQDGFLEGYEVEAILMKSGVDVNELSRICEIADADMDGRLSSHEFETAMQLLGAINPAHVESLVEAAEVQDIKNASGWSTNFVPQEYIENSYEQPHKAKEWSWEDNLDKLNNVVEWDNFSESKRGTKKKKKKEKKLQHREDDTEKYGFPLPPHEIENRVTKFEELQSTDKVESPLSFPMNRQSLKDAFKEIEKEPDLKIEVDVADPHKAISHKDKERINDLFSIMIESQNRLQKTAATNNDTLAEKLSAMVMVKTELLDELEKEKDELRKQLERAAEFNKEITNLKQELDKIREERRKVDLIALGNDRYINYLKEYQSFILVEIETEKRDIERIQHTSMGYANSREKQEQHTAQLLKARRQVDISIKDEKALLNKEERQVEELKNTLDKLRRSKQESIEKCANLQESLRQSEQDRVLQMTALETERGTLLGTRQRRVKCAEDKLELFAEINQIQESFLEVRPQSSSTTQNPKKQFDILGEVFKRRKDPKGIPSNYFATVTNDDTKKYLSVGIE